MKKGNLLFQLFFILFFIFPSEIVADQPDEQGTVENNMLEDLPLDHVQDYWNHIVNEYSGYLPELNKTSFYEFIKNNHSFSIKEILIGFVKYLFYELILNGKLLGLLLLLTLFSTILQTIHNAFEKTSISKVAYLIVYIVLIYLALNSFLLAYSYAENAIETMSSFMIALVPLLLSLLATFGNVISVSFFHPIIIFLIHISGVLVSKFILPLLFLSALLTVVSSINEHYKATHLAQLLRTVALGSLGIFLTIFLGVMSVQGTASGIKDGVAMKTTKFITGNFIPIVGRTFTDAADTILSASLLLKNAIGIVGVIIVIFLALFPAIKILAIALTFKIAAAVLQPVGDGPIITTLNTISKTISFILACLLAVTFMFFLSIVIIVIASNVTLLLR